MQETRVRSLGPEDPLEEKMATYYSIRAWEIPRKEETGELQSMGLQRAGRNLLTEHTRTDSEHHFDATRQTELFQDHVYMHVHSTHSQC